MSLPYSQKAADSDETFKKIFADIFIVIIISCFVVKFAMRLLRCGDMAKFKYLRCYHSIIILKSKLK